MEPRTRVSRGFAFVTMSSLKDAERCIKYLNQSVLEGRYITVERKILHQATIRDDKSTHPCSTSLSETQLDQSNRQLKHNHKQLYCLNSQLSTSQRTLSSINNY
jgi:RNA recognition motif-containing protein